MLIPLISVITVVYNGCKTLEDTIKSVISQDKNLFEYWIIDGGSTDGSVDIIKRYENTLAGWISESDEGIYDAMNKGINRATGEWIYFLGADDLLCIDSLSQIKPYLIEEYVMVYGNIIFNNGRIVESYFNLRTILQNTVHHQATFYKRTLFSNFYYNTELLILSDYELNLKIYKNKLPSRKISAVVAICSTGGASSNLNLSLRETNYIRKKYVSNKILNTGLSYVLQMYYMQKKIRRFFINGR